jgi:hypothetical protein
MRISDCGLESKSMLPNPQSEIRIPQSKNFAPRRPESRTGRFFVQLAHGVRHRAQADDPFVSPA